MASSSRWIPKCRWCGEAHTSYVRQVNGEFPPAQEPEAMLGHIIGASSLCHESSSRKHKFEWVRIM